MRQLYFLSCILLWLPFGIDAQVYSQTEQEEIEASIQASNFQTSLSFENPFEVITFGTDGTHEDFIPTAGATETFTPAVGDRFYDTGGPGGGGLNAGGGNGTELPGNYLNCGCTTTTTLAGVTQIQFHEFEVFGDWDWLKVYDGTDTSGAVLYDSNANSTTDSFAGMIAYHGSAVFTGTSGAMTFEFAASTVVDHTGWDVEILETESTGGGGNCEWTVSVFSSSFGDEISWEFRDADGNTLLSGGPYSSFPYVDTQTITADDPVEFYIESMGTFNDNSASFTIANGNGIILNNAISGGNELTFSNLLCSDLPAPSPDNDNCEDITPTTLTNGVTTTFTGTTEGATGSDYEIDVLGYPAVWEAVTLTGTCNNLTVDYCGTTAGVMDGQMFIIYTDSCTADEFVIGNYDFSTCGDGNGTVRFYNLPAGTYYLPVIVDPTYNTLGEYTMNVLSVDCPPVPDNDDCENATPLSCGDSSSGTTISATDSGGNLAPDVFYSFTGDGTEQLVTVSLCGSTFDTALRVFTDCSLSNEIAFNDDFCGLQSELNFVSDGTSTYYIMVEGYGSNGGDYEINVSCSVPPVFDPCSPVHTGEPTVGIGFSDGYSAANDFNVLAETKFTVEKISFDVATVMGDPTTFDISFYEGESGVETQVGDAFTNITPTAVTPNGYLFGFYPMYTVEIDLPTSQTFEATMTEDKKYWVVISSALDASGGFTYWVAYDYLASSSQQPTWQNDGSTWFPYQDLGDQFEGVMSIEGECETLGLSELSHSDFAFYPNPVKNTLNIVSKKAVETVTVYNMTGQTVINNMKVRNGEINLSALAPGTYLFRATLQGGQVETFKVIKN